MENIPKKHLFLNLDAGILSLPALTFSFCGVGFHHLEENDQKVFQAAGWLGRRVCTIFATFSGILPIIASFAKATFAKIATAVTFNTFEILRDYANYTDEVLTISMAVVSSLFIVIPHVSMMIRAGREFEEVFTTVGAISKKINGYAEVLKAQL